MGFLEQLWKAINAWRLRRPASASRACRPHHVGRLRTQPARGPDRKRLDDFRAWANAQLARRPPPVLLALRHVDELRPAVEWAPPYDFNAPARPKARAIRAAVNASSRALDLIVDVIVPVAMPPEGRPITSMLFGGGLRCAA